MEHIGEILKKQTTSSGGASAPPSENCEDPKCYICDDFGWVYAIVNGAVDYSQTTACRCQFTKEAIARRRQRLMDYCSLPASAVGRTFENFDDYGNPELKEARYVALQLAEGAGEIKWLTLVGQVDHGKTHLAIAVCRRLIERGIPAYFANVSRMLRDLRDGFDQGGDMAYRPRMHRLTTVPFLVLDDLGTERITEWGAEQLQDIIDSRYMDELPLIVTTMKPLDRLFIEDERHIKDWQELATQKVCSRLQRESWCKVVFVGGPEHRLRSCDV